MANINGEEVTAPFAVWGIPSKNVKERLKKLNHGLRSEFGGPELDPHLTVVGMTTLTKKDALKRFKSACNGLKAYPAHSKGVSVGSSFWQCVYLLLDTNHEVELLADDEAYIELFMVMETSAHCKKHFGYTSPSPYMPHMSVLYANLSDEEKQKALEKANALDKEIGNMCFTIDRLELWITDGDETLKSWVKVSEFQLEPICH